MEKGLKRLLERRKKRNKKRLLIIAAVLILAVIIVSLIPRGSGTVTFTIREGTSSSQIAQILKDEGVISSKTWFLMRLKTSKYSGKLQYGTFKVDKNDSIGEIIEILATRGAKKNTVSLTIPEGFSLERIRERVVKLGLCTDSEFDAAIKKDYDYEFLKALPHSSKTKYKLQGFLFPSTYEFYSDASAETVINTLLAEFEKQTSPLGIAPDKLFETLTIASLVEREAKIGSERSLIAGVIKNRLSKDMLLQIDASVVYAISDGMYDVDRVFYKDLEVNSPYNTYRSKGLPAGPICSPGLDSIKAALNPASHNYLYYHTDTKKGDGSHIFTETYEEHTSTMN